MGAPIAAKQPPKSKYQDSKMKMLEQLKFMNRGNDSGVMTGRSSNPVDSSVGMNSYGNLHKSHSVYNTSQAKM